MCSESGKILEVKAVDQVQATGSAFHIRTFLFVCIGNRFFFVVVVVFNQVGYFFHTLSLSVIWDIILVSPLAELSH